MDENTLLKFSLLFSILGILTILFISETVSIDLSKISDITQENIDEKVRLQGTITAVGESPGLLILTLEDETGKITVMIFKDNDTIIEKNLHVEIIGIVSEYKNNVEIIADEIKVV